jgi:imidazolonepropionase-like amidohydrolase
MACAIAISACAGRDTLTIDHVTIMDGNGAVIPDGAIVIEGDRIRDAGPRRTIAPTGRIIDGAGKWAIPGLIDAHIHFDQSGGLYTRPDILDARQRRPYETEIAWIRERAPMTLRRYLASGVTGVVDMGGPMWTFDVRDRARSQADAPRDAVAGPLIATHPSPELETSDPAVIVAESPERARQLVRRVLERRPDLIKILWALEFGDDLERQSEMVRAAIEESHAHGVRVGAHALQLETAKAALRAGADILVHSVEDGRVDAEFIKLLKARNVIYIPTLGAMEGYYKVFGQTGEAVPMTDIDVRFGDPQVIQSWKEFLSIPPESWPHLPPREDRPVMFDNLKEVAASGVRVAVGTDAGNIGTLHGPAIHRELELMAVAGMKPPEILIAATKNAAAVMGRQDEAGVIGKGKVADIILLNADPAADVRNLRNIHRVMKGGVFIDFDRELLAK